MDFEKFKTDVITPEIYVEDAKEMYDADYDPEEYPSYMAICEVGLDMCDEQREIVDNSMDLAVLSSTLRSLPKIAELNVVFFDPTENLWSDSFLYH